MPDIAKARVGAQSARPAGSRLFAEARFARYVTAVAVTCGILMIFAWLQYHPGRAGGHCLDFNWIWLTGKLAASHAAANVYNALPLPPHVATDLAALPQLHCAGTPGDGRFDYPPTILFFTYPLGFFPYFTALAVWVAATLLLYLAAIYAILPRAVALAAALTTYPAAFNILIGHNGFLTAGLFGLALVFLEGRPWLAGIFLGLLTYKPQFGILFPLALLASRNWRAFIAASAASIAFAAAAAIAFGYSLWPSFIAGMTQEASNLSRQHSISNIIFPTVRGILQHMDFSAATSWSLQAAVTAAIAAAIWALWSRPISYSLKAAALGVASLLATPYALTYDFCILGIAVAFLVKDGLERGFLRGERALLLACWGGFSFFAFVAAMFVPKLVKGTGVAEPLLYFFLAVIPVLVCAALFSQIVRRALLLRPDAFGAAAVLPMAARAGAGPAVSGARRRRDPQLAK